MDSLDLVDVIAIVGVIALGLVLERLLRGRLGWLEAAFWPLIGMWRENHPTPAKGVQEEDPVRWHWGPRT
jgi:hypothetical protein